MTFIDPTTLSGIGVTDPNAFYDQNPGVSPGTPVVTPPHPVGYGGMALDQQSGSAIIQAFFQQYQLPITPELGAYSQQIATMGLTAADLNARIAADASDTSSTLGAAVNTVYPEIQLRAKANPGQPMLTLGDVLKQRESISQTMRDAGLPPGFYDKPEDFKDLIVNAGTNAAAFVTSRINDSYSRVANADPSIRSAFAGYFGPSGDAALASYFLDPAKATPALQKQIDAAEVGGTASQFGFGINADQASSLANRGLTGANSRTGFAQVQQLAPVFNETISESNDLTAQGAGFDAAFNLGGNGQQEIQQRLDQRKADFSGGGGAFGSAQTGQSGLGSAQSR